MAIIKFSGLISSIRGSVGGSIFQRSRAGNILRTLTTPINRRTFLQNKSRNINFNILQEWIRLTEAQRSIWEGYTQYNPILQRNGERLFINGQQTFIKFNSYRLEYDLPILIVPIFNKCEVTPVIITVVTDGNTLTANIDRVTIGSSDLLILFATVRFPITNNNPGSKYKIIKFDTADTDTYDITNPYVAIFGRVPQPGETIFIKYTNASKLSGLPFPFKTEKILL